MNIEKVAIESLVFDPTNARKHSQKNLNAIKGSLNNFGQQKPIVIDKNNVIIAGNGTVAAAKDLGWKHIAAYRTELEGDAAMAFALSDNRTAELAEWDDDILKESLAYLQLHDIDISFLDFNLKDPITDIGEEFDNREIEYLIVVTAKNEEEQQLIYQDLKDRGFECKIM